MAASRRHASRLGWRRVGVSDQGKCHHAGKRCGQATLIGALGSPITLICLNSNSVIPIIHDLFVLSAVRVNQMGMTGGQNGPISFAWPHPFFLHDDTHLL
ncbi:hypothetical protein Y032_0310g2106 [Ancylostoma ceylanicum]|uniref:Uncharacterized protein n=1 Tax=Ancylostoma ceylanicum TaxID=53326 RepID=A0A016S3F1_9BILA|nr:hypothetical protein Y032_0310g2106 [Ancylostoma ceylanicum]